MRSRWGTVMKICLQNWGKIKLGNAPLKRNMLFNLRGMDRYTSEVNIYEVDGPPKNYALVTFPLLNLNHRTLLL